MNPFKKSVSSTETEEAMDERPRGTWESVSSFSSDDEAHRNVRYEIPNVLSQTISMFRTQMGLYSKKKSIYVILFLALLIPAIYVAIKGNREIMVGLMRLTENTATGLMGLLLSMLPFILALFAAFICGSSIPSEFRDRCAYMNMALPMSRTSFCLGKYLAGFVITMGVFVFAYGMAMVTAMTEFDSFDEQALGRSFLMVVLATLFASSFAFFMGCLMKRGSSIVSMLLLFLVIPALQVYLFSYDYISADLLQLMPNLLPDMACLTLGCLISASPVGLANFVKPMLDPSEFPLMTSAIVAIVCTLIFLMMGIMLVNRREM